MNFRVEGVGRQSHVEGGGGGNEEVTTYRYSVTK